MLHHTLLVLFTLAACSLAAGCSDNSDNDADSRAQDRERISRDTRIGDRTDARLPRGAKQVARSDGPDKLLSYRSTRPGTLYVVDQTADTILHTQRLSAGQGFNFDPQSGRARLGQSTVATTNAPRDHDFALYFLNEPNP